MAAEITVHLRQTSPCASEAAIRQHAVHIDRPAPKGGTDTGPMGGELFLAAVGGCFMSNLLAAVKSRDAAVSDVKLEVTGVLVDAPARFAEINMRVMAASGDPALLAHLIEIADRGCIMMNTLRAVSGVRLSIQSESRS